MSSRILSWLMVEPTVDAEIEPLAGLLVITGLIISYLRGKRYVVRFKGLSSARGRGTQ